ncbi:MAG: CPBP family intramembrane glutamic endopeptidase [Filifactoraceae bacterium]
MNDSTNLLEKIFSNPIAAFLQVCVTAPIAEEVLIRGYFMKILKERYSIFLQ